MGPVAAAGPSSCPDPPTTEHRRETAPVYTWNVAGYGPGHGPSGRGNRHVFGGLHDGAFRAVPLLERGASAPWPF